MSLSYVPAPSVGITLEMLDLPVLTLFRKGFDTHQIALVKKQPEHLIYKWLNEALDAEYRRKN